MFSYLLFYLFIMDSWDGVVDVGCILLHNILIFNIVYAWISSHWSHVILVYVFDLC